MDISQIINTYILLNLKSENIANVLLSVAIIYMMKNYHVLLKILEEFYTEYIYKKCTIHLEMKVQTLSSINRPIYYNSNKVLGLLYKLKGMNIKAKTYTEVHAEIELDDNKDNPNFTQLIPKLVNYKIKDDIYISTDINTDNVIDNFNNTDGRKEKNILEYKLITISLTCYKHDINYIKEFVEECEEEYIKFLNRNVNKSCIYISNCGYDGDEKFSKFSKYNFSSTKSFSNLFFEGKELILTRIDNYLNNSSKYKTLGIPHTLGFLFHGSPGTGKTSTIKAIANYTNRTIISINMRHMENVNTLIKIFNHDFLNQFKLPINKRLYVFEEIDCCDSFFSREIKEEIKEKVNISLSNEAAIKALKEKEKEEYNKITVGSLLEVLDGIIEPEDRMCIFTTNHIEKIDKAFLRPGRIDVIMEFKKLRKVDIQNLFKIWFNKPIPEKDLCKIKDYTVSQAEFGKICFDNLQNPNKVISKLATFQN